LTGKILYFLWERRVENPKRIVRQARFDPTNRWALFPDLGCDRVRAARSND
jgi:hypothetical protein